MWLIQQEQCKNIILNANLLCWLSFLSRLSSSDLTEKCLSQVVSTFYCEIVLGIAASALNSSNISLSCITTDTSNKEGKRELFGKCLDQNYVFVTRRYVS